MKITHLPILRGFSNYYFFLFWRHLQHVEVPELGVESELQLLAYTAATATSDWSHVFNLHSSYRPPWIPHPLSKARDQTRILTDTSQIHFHCAIIGIPALPGFELKWNHRKYIFVTSFIYLFYSAMCW